jgi:hypothetical protein
LSVSVYGASVPVCVAFVSVCVSFLGLSVPVCVALVPVCVCSSDAELFADTTGEDAVGSNGGWTTAFPDASRISS